VAVDPEMTAACTETLRRTGPALTPVGFRISPVAVIVHVELGASNVPHHVTVPPS